MTRGSQSRIRLYLASTQVAHWTLSQTAKDISGHAADHLLAMVTAQYKNFYEVSKATRRRALNSRPSDPGSRSSLRASDNDSTGSVVVKHFMTVPTNSLDDPLLVTEQTSADSDTEACGGDSMSCDFPVLSLRNRAALTKHGNTRAAVAMFQIYLQYRLILHLFGHFASVTWLNDAARARLVESIG